MREIDLENEFGKMWGVSIGNYALIRSETPMKYTIINTVYNSMVIIDNDEIAQYVITKMINNGVRIANNEIEVMNSNRPDPIFYSSQHEIQYRAVLKKKKKGKGER
ncbi:MAG TPA: hypothetical protein PLM56_12940 [Cyclobacteriaceae bacterium]|nr:hypothetical protein [Cyclobacteriaceae bacterium]HRF34403.1 hypothetical protein [Cyclobacteriaceae bacterium]